MLLLDDRRGRPAAAATFMSEAAACPPAASCIVALLCVAMPLSLLQISEQQNDQALEVAVGGKIIVALGCNRSTGNTWSIVPPLPAELREDGASGYNAPPRPGAWGEEVFTFLAARPGSARLRMSYARPDDPAAKPGRTFGVIINVRGEGTADEDPPSRAKATSKSSAKKAPSPPAKKPATEKSAAKTTSKKSSKR